MQGMSVCSLGELALGVYYFAKVNSPILDHFYLSDPYFHVGAFSFAIRESVKHDENPDYYVYQITLGEETYTCLLGFVSTVTVPCGATSSINFTEFLWDNTVVFLSKSTGLWPFHSIHLGSSTYVIMGLKARAGHSLQYANMQILSTSNRPFFTHVHGQQLVQVQCVSQANPFPPKSSFLHGVPHDRQYFGIHAHLRHYMITIFMLCDLT